MSEPVFQDAYNPHIGKLKPSIIAEIREISKNNNYFRASAVDSNYPDEIIGSSLSVLKDAGAIRLVNDTAEYSNNLYQIEERSFDPEMEKAFENFFNSAIEALESDTIDAEIVLEELQSKGIQRSSFNTSKLRRRKGDFYSIHTIEFLEDLGIISRREITADQFDIDILENNYRSLGKIADSNENYVRGNGKQVLDHYYSSIT